MKNSKIIFAAYFVLGFILLMTSCNESKQKEQETPRGVPVIVVDTLVFDDASKTFSLTIHADSTAGAQVTYFLFDEDSLMQKNEEGVFHNIVPFVEGYNVQAQVVWADTTILTPLTHVSNFIAPIKPVEPLSKEELQNLINSQDKSILKGETEQLIQDVAFVTKDEGRVYMQDVFMKLLSQEWSSVEVVEVKYNDLNQITNVTLKPKIAPAAPIVEDDDEWIDEY